MHVCMCVMYVYVCIYIYIHTHVYKYICIDIISAAPVPATPAPPSARCSGVARLASCTEGHSSLQSGESEWGRHEPFSWTFGRKAAANTCWSVVHIGFQHHICDTLLTPFGFCRISSFTNPSLVIPQSQRGFWKRTTTCHLMITNYTVSCHMLHVMRALCNTVAYHVTHVTPVYTIL